MVNEWNNPTFDIRYVKLHFYLKVLEDSIFPSFKTSALRGGIGEMLLRANCIQDRNCKNCDFIKECIVQRTMYSQYEIQPAFVTEGDSIGYVLECDDFKERYYAGDELSFRLILFGKTIVYFSQYLQAVYALGQHGLGKDMARFTISRITNSRGKDILNGFDVEMKNYTVEKVSSYVEYRTRKLSVCNGQAVLRFSSPLTLKFHGEILESFNMEAILKSVQRRIYLMNCFEGIEGIDEYNKVLPVPVIVAQNPVEKRNIRYSSRKDQKMPLKGIRGDIYLESIPEECMPVLIAGELLHIGKNTSFGYGKYQIIPV